MQLKRRRILFVEDHADTRELVTFILEDCGYEVISDDTIAGALGIAKSQSFDLFLLDSWLPDGSGFELCKKLRQFETLTPILFYSAAAYEVDRENALNSGAQDYLTKPGLFSELTDRISDLIDAAQLAQLGVGSASA